jgi:hypothetical protein
MGLAESGLEVSQPPIHPGIRSAPAPAKDAHVQGAQQLRAVNVATKRSPRLTAVTT